jgi:Zn-dependent peptidase ImmA (M78 family)
MSIDSPSARMPNYVPDAANFNYIDTYVEFIVEDILKYDNAIPETKNRQNREWQMQKQFELVCQQIEPIVISTSFQKNKKNYIAFINKYSFRYINEINPPPPKTL